LFWRCISTLQVKVFRKPDLVKDLERHQYGFHKVVEGRTFANSSFMRR
jgi:hypothetical protein